MLKGKEFGAAIGAAIQKKLDSGAVRSKAEIARHFGIKPPSLYDWEKKGSVDKSKLTELWRYFSDVVGPEHWGMTSSEWPFGLSQATADSGKQFEASKPLSPSVSAEPWPFAEIDEKKLRSVRGPDAHKLEGAILLAAAQLGLDVKKDA